MLPKEKASDFTALLDQFYSAVGPTDSVEEMYTHDLVCNLWETRRIRMYKTRLLEGNLHQAVRFFLEDLKYGVLGIDSSVSGWRRKIPQVQEEVDDELQSAGISQETLLAQTVAINIDTIEKLELEAQECTEIHVHAELHGARKAMLIQLETSSDIKLCQRNARRSQVKGSGSLDVEHVRADGDLKVTVQAQSDNEKGSVGTDARISAGC